LNAALAKNTAGYVMQLRQHGQPIASAQVGWAKEPSDGSESWAQTVRMHIASCSKLITAIAMTRTLAAHNLPPSTKIVDYLPTYWAKGPNIDKINFAELMTHTSGFRVAGSDTFYPIMKAQVAAGVTNANLGVYSYQNMNFSLCRILIPVMNGTIPANTVFPPPFEDQFWDYVTITAYANYIAQNLFQPAGVSGPTFTHPNPDAPLRLPTRPWLGLRRSYRRHWRHKLAHVGERSSGCDGLLPPPGHDHVAHRCAGHARCRIRH
jgi:CubicO group peptidase (beta-lactamase class C family)